MSLSKFEQVRKYLESRERRVDLGGSSGDVAVERAGLAAPRNTSTLLPNSSMINSPLGLTNMPKLSWH